MDKFLDVILTSILPSLLTGVGTWFFTRRKQNAEVSSSELDNVEKALVIYRGIINDLNEKIKQLETELEVLQKIIEEHKKKTIMAEERAQLIVFPFGNADSISKAYAAAVSVDVNNTKSIVTIAQLTGNTTINLNVHAEMRVGAELHIQVSADGTNRTITHGTGMTGAATVITANKSNILSYVFNGSAFVLTGNNQTN